MVGAILAFVLGVWCLQQMPQLPDPYWAVMLLLPLVFVWGVRGTSHFAIQLTRRISLMTICAGAGFFFAAGQAQLRLADALPAAWEGRDIQLVGVVAALPQTQERGQRFLFDVEQIETPGAHVPQRISVTYYLAGFRESVRGAATQQFHAGERWRLTLRLKRPHGSYNPHGFDFEAWALERNIRATGYVRKSPANARLQPLVWRPGYLVEHLREKIRERLQRVLGDARYGGMLLALVIGDEGAIEAADWQVFLRTGVNHLMSIC